MTVPLYNSCEKPLKCEKEGNRGLWFERFADFYEPDFRILKKKMIDGKEENPGAAWLKKHFNGKKVGDDQQLATHAQAQMQLVQSLQGQSYVFKASWHFVTGMGNPHPVENGFAWHPTLGVPYLTGAAVKGLLRSYIENNLDTENPENPDKKQLLLDWFGSDHKDPKEQDYDSQAGNLIFFDALPTKLVTLGVDIMTPHMGKWYEKGGTDGAVGTPEAVPADWHDPVPVAFLVAREINLLFSFALRPYPDADKKRPEIDLAEVADVLNRALEQAGAGGKTATGYGEMRADPKALQDFNAIIEEQAKERIKQARQAEEQAIREAALANMSPIERTMAECAPIADAIKTLESTKEWSATERQQAAQLLKVRMQQEGVWKESSAAKNPEKDKDYKRTQIVMKLL